MHKRFGGLVQANHRAAFAEREQCRPSAICVRSAKKKWPCCKTSCNTPRLGRQRHCPQRIRQLMPRYLPHKPPYTRRPGRRLPAVHLSKPTLPVVSPRRAAPAAEAGTGHSQPQETPPLRSLRHGHPRPLRQGKILPRLRQGHPPSAESKVRPQTAVGRRQFGGEKPLNCKHSRTTKAARQYDFPRSREIEFYLST